MEQHIISPKLLISGVVYGIITLVTSVVLQYVFFSPHIIVCNEASGTAYVIKLSRTYEIVIPTSSIKDTITCMGRGMAFYDRTVDIFLMKTENRTFIAQLEKRYAINRVALVRFKNQAIQVMFDNERILLRNQGLAYVLYPKAVKKPFKLLRTEQNSDIVAIISPPLDPVIQGLIAQYPQEQIPLISIKVGEHKSIKLAKK